MAIHLPVRTLAATALVVAMGVVVVLSCSSVTEGPATPSEDARVEPVRPTDAGKRDVAERDAFVPITDAAGISIPGDWVETGTLKASCGLRTLRNPETIVPFPWRPCPDSGPGCQTFTADWEERGTTRAFEPAYIDPVFEDENGVVRVSYTRDMKFNDPFGYQVVQSMDGPAEVALSQARAGCGLHAQASKYGLSAVLVDSVEPQGYVAWGPRTAGASLTTVATNVSPSLYVYQGVATGDGFLALEATNFGGPIVGAAYKFTEGAFVGPTAGHTMASEGVRPVAGGFVGVFDTKPWAVGFSPLTGGLQILARPSPGQLMSSLSVDRKQNALVWTERTSDEVHTVWTSPMATTEATMQPRKVARAQYTSLPVANAGMFLTTVGERLARLVRLSDGMGWDIPPVGDLLYLQGLWVNDDAIWILASKVYSGGSPANSAVRITRASLGPPTVAPGL